MQSIIVASRIAASQQGASYRKVFDQRKALSD
jgi:hypothetical protein